MVLTEEQRKRMEENRKRALEIKRKKQSEKEKKELVEGTSSTDKTTTKNDVFEAGGFVSGESNVDEGMQNKKRRTTTGGSVVGKSEDVDKKGYGKGTTNNDSIDDDESSLEEFEQNATPYISQTEAQRTYCIPLGTLAVCSYIEKDNPHKRGWSKMKLYLRSEVRKRARKRFGGKEGLIEEREKRKRKRYEKDMEDVKDVFR